MAPDPPSNDPATGNALRVAITGSSGFLGAALIAHLRREGARVHRLIRGAPSSAGDIGWEPAAGRIDVRALEGVDVVVNLAGEPIAQRWTEHRKRLIRDSRVTGTTLLARTLASLRLPPRALLSASAIGIYGERGDEVVDERSRPGEGFLADVGRAWEAATEPAQAGGIRVVLLRTGLVLSPRGGALAKMLLPYKLGLGGRVGSARQWMSWIALGDWMRAAVFLARSPGVAGPVNLVAPNAVTNEAFGKTLARVVHRPAIVPLPSIAVDLLFGEMGRATLLGSQRVVPRRLEEAGFEFAQPMLEGALRQELLVAGD